MNNRSKIQIKEKLCRCGCGKMGVIFSKGLILSCRKREYAKNRKVVSRKLIAKVSDKQKIKNEIKKEKTKELHEWFLKIWDATEDAGGYCYCFETGTRMHRSIYRTNTCCYHHPLEKAKYPQYATEEWNILIVLPTIHTQAHSNIDKTPRIKIYTQELKNKY